MKLYRAIKSMFKAFFNEFSSLIINFYLFRIKETIILPEKEKKVISFCLFGSDQKYFGNISACIESYHTLFKNWIIRIYISEDLPNEIINKLKEYNCELITMKAKGIDYRYTFWRFLVLDDKNVSIALIRDIDSIASKREQTMVDQWLDSQIMLHIIRDHPDHADLIMGGLFDRRFDASFNVKKAMYSFKKINQLGIDQQFLKSVYEHYAPAILVHDIFKRYPTEHPIIIPHEDNCSFVGEINMEHRHKQRDLNNLKQFYRSDINTANTAQQFVQDEL